jgi:DNA polymerase III subunit alpha
MPSLQENIHAGYCPIHVHSHVGSVLDSLITIPRLVERVKNLGMKACGLSDHGTLAGCIDFYKECKKQGIKPLLGMEAYSSNDIDDLDNESKSRDNYHLLLIAMNTEGWHNLIYLNNMAHLHNFYYNPRIYIGNLEKYSAGIICTSACIAGMLGFKKVDEGKISVRHSGVFSETGEYADPTGECEKAAESLSGIFGDRFYLEIQNHPNREQSEYNKWIIKLSKRRNIPLVITTDAHYLTKEDKETHDMLKALQFKETIENYRVKHNMNLDISIREPEELYNYCQEIGEVSAFWNTGKISERCNLEIQLGKYSIPTFDITKCEDYEDFLRWSNER